MLRLRYSGGIYPCCLDLVRKIRDRGINLGIIREAIGELRRGYRDVDNRNRTQGSNCEVIQERDT